jgi:hypothetical protein
MGYRSDGFARGMDGYFMSVEIAFDKTLIPKLTEILK